MHQMPWTKKIYDSIFHRTVLKSNFKYFGFFLKLFSNIFIYGKDTSELLFLFELSITYLQFIILSKKILEIDKFKKKYCLNLEEI